MADTVETSIIWSNLENCIEKMITGYKEELKRLGVHGYILYRFVNFKDFESSPTTSKSTEYHKFIKKVSAFTLTMASINVMISSKPSVISQTMSSP